MELSYQTPGVDRCRRRFTVHKSNRLVKTILFGKAETHNYIECEQMKTVDHVGSKIEKTQ